MIAIMGIFEHLEELCNERGISFSSWHSVPILLLLQFTDGKAEKLPFPFRL
mgnify:CR=1 FL=1